MPPITFVPLISVTPGLADDTPNPIVDKIFDVIEYIYENSGLKALVACDNPKYTRGWKVDWVPNPDLTAEIGGVEIGLRTPSISWAPCGCYDVIEWPMLSAGLSSAAMVSRKLRRKAVRKISAHVKNAFGSAIQSFRARWYKFKNWGVGDWDKFVKLPPVPPGYKRLYRMNSGGTTAIASNTNGYGTGRWFTDNPQYPPNHSRFMEGATHVTYVDVPIDVANDCHMGNPNSKWRKILADSGEQMNGGRGADASRLIDNPARFVGGESIAKSEYFIDADFANKATKIAQFTGLPDLEEFDTAWKKFERIFKEYDAEKFLDDIAYRSDFISRWNKYSDDFKSLCSKYFDNSDDVFKWLFEGSPWYSVPNVVGDEVFPIPSIGISNIFSEERTIMKRTAYCMALIAFITEIMTVTDLVRNKNCSRRDNPSYGLTPKDKEYIAEVRATEIRNKIPTWAELNPDTCECSECPEDWNFCSNSSITNFWSDKKNTCIPPCCGGREFKVSTLVSTCKCDCPEGKVFMPCECSDCVESPYFISALGQRPVKGFCVDNNPDPSKLEWNTKSCSWECKNYKTIYPPYMYAMPYKEPLEPCKSDGVRKPNSCECSGGYSIDPCTQEKIKNMFNIVPIYQIDIIDN